jgi:hypothetical protein
MSSESSSSSSDVRNSSRSVSTTTTTSASQEKRQDKSKKEFKCRRRGCHGTLTNIGFAPIGRTDATPRDLSESIEIAKRERTDRLVHGSHFSCSDCGETPVVPSKKKKEVVRAWHRYCSVCENVFATNSFYTEHGGEGKRLIKHPDMTRRSLRHKRKLVSLLFNIRKKRDKENNQSDYMEEIVSELPMENGWLMSATKGSLKEEKSKEALERSIETFCGSPCNVRREKRKKKKRKSPLCGKGDVADSLSKLSLVSSSPPSPTTTTTTPSTAKQATDKIEDIIQPVELLSEFQSITLDPIDKDIAKLFEDSCDI